jgi:hypothetical protein
MGMLQVWSVVILHLARYESNTGKFAGLHNCANLYKLTFTTLNIVRPTEFQEEPDVGSTECVIR